MATSDVKLTVATKQDHSAILECLNAHFSKQNPLNILLPVPDEELSEFHKELSEGNLSVIAHLDEKIIGCRTGYVMTYGELKVYL
jgi:hypothetical protein